MFHLYLSVAGFLIKISCGEMNYFDYPKRQLIHNIKNMYRGFLVKTPIHQTVDHTIYLNDTVTFEIAGRKSIQKEYLRFYRKINESQTETWYHVSATQFAVLIKMIIDSLLVENNGCTLHASAVAYEDKAIVFLGKSTAGKTTAMRLLYPEYTPIADDGIILRKIMKTYFCYQLPLEKVSWFKRDSSKYKLKACVILHKSEKNRIKPLSTVPDSSRLLEYFWFEEQILNQQVTLGIDLLRSYKRWFILEFQKNKSTLLKLMDEIRLHL